MAETTTGGWPPSPSALPTVLHLSAFPFGPRHHPGIWRTVRGLTRHFRNIVVSGRISGYFQDDTDCDRLAAETGIQLLAGQDIRELKNREVTASLAATIANRYGPIDAIIGHLLGGARALGLARLLEVPVLTFFHGDDANIHLNGTKYGVDYAELREAPGAFFLAVSQNLVERLIAFGMPPERTFLHHLGVELAGYPVASRLQTGRPVKIVMAGMFRRQKGHLMAIRGFAKFVRRFPGASFDFVGGAIDARQQRLGEELVTLVERKGLGASIRFRGRMPVEALAREFADADIALQTSVFIPEDRQIEGVPNAILEAMATGLPVVATRHGGIPEAVQHQRTGLLVEEDDIEGLTDALGSLAADSGLRRRYGLEGRRIVEERFNAARQCDLMAERIRKMIEGYARLGPGERSEWHALSKRPNRVTNVR